MTDELYNSLFNPIPDKISIPDINKVARLGGELEAKSTLLRKMSATQCTKCQSQNTYRNGWNRLKSGEKQPRYYCNDCGKTFQIKKN